MATYKANLHLSPSNNVILPGSASNDLLVYVGTPAQSVLFGVSNTQTLMKVDGTGNVAFSGNVSYCNQINLSGLVITQKQTTAITNLTSQVTNIDGFSKLSGNVSIITDSGDKYIRFMQSTGTEYARITSTDSALTVYGPIKSSNASSITTMNPTGFTGDGANIINLSAGNIATGTLPVTRGGTGAATLTASKVLVGNGTSAPLQPTNLHWDNTNSRLGIGTTTPAELIDINGNIATAGIARITNTGVLQNVTTNASIITAGTVATARLPAASTTAAGIVQLTDSTTTTSSVVAATATAAKSAYDMAILAVPIGTILQYSGSTAPTGWFLCNGANVSRTTYLALYNIVGVTYGTGDGSTTFSLPDFQGRVPVGSGTGTGLTARTLGAKGGEEAHALTVAEMASHTHTASTGGMSANAAHTHTITDPGHFHSATTWKNSANNQYSYNNTWGGDDGAGNSRTVNTTTKTTGISVDSTNIDHTHAVTVNSSGSGTAFNVMQPYIVINYIIKY